MAELADALDSKSSVVTLRAGSSPAFGTIENIGLAEVSARPFLRNLCLKNGREHIVSVYRAATANKMPCHVSIICCLCYNVMYILKGNSVDYDF